MRTPDFSTLLRIILATSSICLAPPIAHADEIYRWQERGGQPAYGDSPPAGARSRVIDATLTSGTNTPQTETIEETVPQPSKLKRKLAVTENKGSDTPREQSRNDRESTDTALAQELGGKHLRNHPECQRARAAEIARLRELLQGC